MAGTTFSSLYVCSYDFSVAEAAETSDENPAEGRQEITIINTNHITWPVIGEMPSYELEVPAGAHYFINMVEWTTKNGENTLLSTDKFEEGEYELHVTYEAKEGYQFAAPELITVLPGNEVQGTPKVEESENGWYRIVTFSFTARQSEKHQHDMLVVQENYRHVQKPDIKPAISVSPAKAVSRQGGNRGDNGRRDYASSDGTSV